MCYITIVGARQGPFKGESKQPGHEDAIEGLRLEYAVGAAFDPSTGQPTGKTQHQSVQFTKAAGAATPQLLQALLTKEQITSITIDFLDAPGDSTEIQRMVFTNALIVDFHHQFDALPDPRDAAQLRDDITLTYQKLEMRDTRGATSATDSWATRLGETGGLRGVHRRLWRYRA